MRRIGLWRLAPERSLHLTHFRSYYLNSKSTIRESFAKAEVDNLEKRWTSLLGFFADQQDVSNGKSIHAQIVKTIPNPDLFLSNSLVNMYCKCGFMDEARQLFDKIHQPDVVSWNTILNGYCLSGSISDAFFCFRKMIACGIKPDRVGCNGILKVCGFVGVTGLCQGLQVHCLSLKYGLDRSNFVANALIEFYYEFGFIGDSSKIFVGLDVKDDVLINTMIGVLSKDGDFTGAFANFRYLLSKSMRLSRATLVNLVGVTRWNWYLVAQGMQVHGLLIKLGFESDGHVENSLVMMYSSCDFLSHAHCLLNYSTSYNVISWTTLMTSYSNIGFFVEAGEIFRFLYSKCHIALDTVFFTCILEALANAPEYLHLGDQIHSVIHKVGFGGDSSILDSLVNMYSKCKSMQDALQIFQQNEFINDLHSWTILISGYVHNGLLVEAFRSFNQMNRVGISPDSVACISILLGCSDMKSRRQQGEQIYSCIIKLGVECDISTRSTLISFYSECGCLDSVRRVFAVEDKHDIVSWTALVSGYMKLGHNKEALACLLLMLRDGIRPNQVTIACLLAASAELISILNGSMLHSFVLKSGMQHDSLIGTALVDMYSKSGSLENAISCFKGLPKDDIVLWNALLSGCAQHGDVANLTLMYKELQKCKVEPDGLTFLALMSAFSHRGLAEFVVYCFFLILKIGICPEAEHVACVVDALGRAGLIDEAVRFLQGPGSRHDGPLVLRTLLSSCAAYGRNKLGMSVVAKMVVSGDDDTATYALFSNLCAAEGMWEDATRVREVTFVDSHGSKHIGRSWIECRASLR